MAGSANRVEGERAEAGLADRTTQPQPPGIPA